MSEEPTTGRKGRRHGARAEVRVLLISLLALLVPIAAAAFFPEQLDDYEALLWLAALVPAFLFSYQRGWEGAATALAVGMATISLTYAFNQLAGGELPDLLFAVVVVYIAISLGLGWFAEMLHRKLWKDADAVRLVDPATRLPTWSYAGRHLELEFEAARRGRDVSVVRFDVDRMKDYNMQRGRRAGDLAVRAFADVLASHTRRMNVSARVGPDQDGFISITSSVGADGATIFAQRVLKAYRSLAAKSGLPTVSAGVAAYTASMSEPDDLVRAAGEAVRQAKLAGGDRLRVHGITVAAKADGDPVVESSPLAGGFQTRRGALTVGPAAVAIPVLEELRTRRLTPRSVNRVGQALERLGENFDLMVVDLGIESALDLIEAVSAHGLSTQVVAVAPQGDHGATVAALHAGAIRCVSAPVEGRDVAEAIGAALRERDRQVSDLLERMQLSDEYEARERQARRTLHETEEHYRTVVEGIREVVFRVDTEGRWLFLNQSWRRLTGSSVEQTLGHTFHDVVHGEDRRRAGDAFDSLLSGQLERYQDEIRIVDADGAEVWVEVNASATLDDEGHVIGASGTLVDVTRRRLLEDQLRQAQKMEAVGRLAGGIAHDFNNLLTAIRGHAELVLEDAPGGEPGASLRRDLGEVVRSVDRASALTRQLLAFSRKQMLEPRIIDLGSVVREFEGMLRRVIGEDIELGVEVAPDLGAVEADPAQMEQVLMNLAVNARDAMPNGGRLHVRLEPARVRAEQDVPASGAPPGRYVRMLVRDSGTGMSDDVLAHAFEPFFTTKEPGRGTGLGLATVYGIIAQSGGYVELQSEPGQGTTFEILLPTVKGRPPPRETREPQRLEHVTGGRLVLLVEDEASVRKLVSRILERGGYRVLAADGAEEALRLSRSPGGGAPDLLITDVVMPGLSGPELARQLQQSRPGTRVLFISGYAEEEMIQRGGEDLDAPLLKKPFAADELLDRVGRILAA